MYTTRSIFDLLAEQLRPLVDQELSLVFYDMTKIRTEGLSEQADELRRYKSLADIERG
ncbi:hypothetical protein [Marinobacterium rhizophilum]|uniref:Uncharacterized protein n=1 Tax=Marinobacterium rhizophilum TaxID=420402 RepID=A0ABY5HI55_9GAMM|nr:hypothetical protein [Marinobacterium rhizophilum]UTW11531.1 hypothetical protein KDW95_20115 [Marinobacterium rhizophilum]